jgi:glycosyltransferase involved in cell wall biosynthesis
MLCLDYQTRLFFLIIKKISKIIKIKELKKSKFQVTLIVNENKIKTHIEKSKNSKSHILKIFYQIGKSYSIHTPKTKNDLESFTESLIEFLEKNNQVNFEYILKKFFKGDNGKIPVSILDLAKKTSKMHLGSINYQISNQYGEQLKEMLNCDIELADFFGRRTSLWNFLDEFNEINTSGQFSVDKIFAWIFSSPLDKPLMNRLIYQIYSCRTDLQKNFSMTSKTLELDLWNWFRSFGIYEYKIASLQKLKHFNNYDKSVNDSFKQGNYGINLISHLGEISGISESTQMYVMALEQALIPINYSANTKTRSFHTSTKKNSDGFSHSTNLIIQNGDSIKSVTNNISKEIFEVKRNIGVWAWELSSPPRHFQTNVIKFDEIWCISDFVRNSVSLLLKERRIDYINLKKIPIPITAKSMKNLSKENRLYYDKLFESLNLQKNNYIFFNFDYLSDYYRKNPSGVVKAFLKFKLKGSESNFKLIIKSINATFYRNLHEELITLAKNREDIIIVDGDWEQDMIEYFLIHSKIYMSLHRSEGFGLGMAKAMAYGIPVIATAYSGNLDYMNHNNSFLVDFNLVNIKESTNRNYLESNSKWAEPSIEQAAILVGKIIEDKKLSDSKISEAKIYIENYCSIQNVANTIGDSIVPKKSKTSKFLCMDLKFFGRDLD